MDDLRGNMAKGGRAGKDLWHRESACRHAESGRRGRPRAWFRSDWEPVLHCFAGKRRAQKLTIGLRLSPIPVCSQINNYDRDQLWTSAALVVDGLGVRLRGFRKSHHFIPAAPR
jgi:hypothetical protein